MTKMYRSDSPKEKTDTMLLTVPMKILVPIGYSFFLALKHQKYVASFWLLLISRSKRLLFDVVPELSQIVSKLFYSPHVHTMNLKPHLIIDDLLLHVLSYQVQIDGESNHSEACEEFMIHCLSAFNHFIRTQMHEQYVSTHLF